VVESRKQTALLTPQADSKEAPAQAALSRSAAELCERLGVTQDEFLQAQARQGGK
jgi:phage I-like protein